MAMEIVFVVRRLARSWPDIHLLEEDDIARLAGRLRGGTNSWIVQSWLRLRRPLEASGFTVGISGRFRPGAICIAHRDDLNNFTDFCERAYVVGVRADRPPIRVGNRHVVQNRLAGRSPTERYLPLWPQPGLLPRDPSRGERIERIAYFGRDSAAPAWFFDPRFRAALGRLGVEFELRTEAWHDYRDVDLVLAHRDEAPTMLRQKPASKLINAWLAGVPALLAPEPAFAALRESALDYRVVDSPGDVIRQVAQLKGDPACYRAMVRNASRRSHGFDSAALKARWLEFLVEDVLPDYRRWRERAPAVAVGVIAFAARLAWQKLEAKAFRAAVAQELRRPAPRANPASSEENGLLAQW
jgi:hypothetical protein